MGPEGSPPPPPARVATVRRPRTTCAPGRTPQCRAALFRDARPAARRAKRAGDKKRGAGRAISLARAMWPRRLPVFLVRGVAYAGEVRITLSVEANARALARSASGGTAVGPPRIRPRLLAPLSDERRRLLSGKYLPESLTQVDQRQAFRRTSSPVIRQVSSRKLDAGRPTASASRYSVSRLGHFRPRSMRARYPRSEERRVGKEGSCRGRTVRIEKNNDINNRQVTHVC